MTDLITYEVDDFIVISSTGLELLTHQLNVACQTFKGRDYHAIIEDDTQYDIFSLEEWYKTEWSKISPNRPDMNLYYSTIKKNCKHLERISTCKSDDE